MYTLISIVIILAVLFVAQPVLKKVNELDDNQDDSFGFSTFNKFKAEAGFFKTAFVYVGIMAALAVSLYPTIIQSM
jgi:hypothetical protein